MRSARLPVLAIAATVAAAALPASAPAATTDPIAAPTLSLHFATREAPSEPVRHATLRCVKMSAHATGYLRGQARAACGVARRNARLILTQPDPDRICTQIYGGPQTSRVTGRVDGTAADRRFARTNGCEIREWNAMGLLLPRLLLPTG